jgi:hypothetical protein
MKIQIENLKMQMKGVQLNAYQRGLALNEYYKLLDYVDELEKLTIPNVGNQRELLIAFMDFCKEKSPNSFIHEFRNADADTFLLTLIKR